MSGEIRLTDGYFFGFKEADEYLTYIDIDKKIQLIGKGDCQFEYLDDKPDDAAQEAINLLKSKGYRIVKD